MTRCLALALLLGGCTPAPSSVEAFRADPAAAQSAVDDCAQGRRKGEICENARRGLVEAKRDARMNTLRKGFE